MASANTALTCQSQKIPWLGSGRPSLDTPVTKSRQGTPVSTPGVRTPLATSQCLSRTFTAATGGTFLVLGHSPAPHAPLATFLGVPLPPSPSGTSLLHRELGPCCFPRRPLTTCAPRAPDREESSAPPKPSPSKVGPTTPLPSLEYFLTNPPAVAPQNPKPRRRKVPSRAQEGNPPPEVEGPLFSQVPGLPAPVLARLDAAGYTRGTPIQVAAIPVLLEGRSAAIQSYTGSGKTLAYLVPLLMAAVPEAWVAADSGRGREAAAEGEHIQGGGDGGGVRERGIKAVVVAPSQELAMQIVREAQRLLGPDFKSAVQQLIGGANPRRQEEALKKGKPAVVVGTPGRLSELSRAGKLQTHGCRVLVLDESDALLSHHFRPDMLRLLEHVGRPKGRGGVASSPKSGRQMVLVSATMSGAVLEAATRWAADPLLIQCSAEGVLPLRAIGQEQGQMTLSQSSSMGAGPNPLDGPEDAAGAAPMGQPWQEEAAAGGASGAAASLSPSLKHYFVVVSQRHKVEVLRRCLNATGAVSAMVFMNFPQRLQDVQHKLEARGVSAAMLHGQMSKVARGNVLSSFRAGKVQVLLLSDVGARGLDVPECDVVVNLELPSGPPHYAHRAGRTGRLGRKGTVITICEEAEAFVVAKWQRRLGVPFIRAETVGGELLPYEGRMKL